MAKPYLGPEHAEAIASRLATPVERRMLEDPETRTAEEVRAVVASTGAAFRAFSQEPHRRRAASLSWPHTCANSAQ